MKTMAVDVAAEHTAECSSGLWKVPLTARMANENTHVAHKKDPLAARMAEKKTPGLWSSL